MSAGRQAEQSIVVRLWWEPHDPEVRARIVVTPLDISRAVRGRSDVEQALRDVLAEVLDQPE